MQNKSEKEKGFRKIQIVDSNFESSEQFYESEGSNKLKLIAVIVVVFLIILLLILLGIYLFSGKKTKRSKRFGGSIFNGVKNNYNYSYNLSNNFDNNNNENNEQNAEEEYDIEKILKSVEKKVQKPDIKIPENIKISIIIMNNDKSRENNLGELYESIESQSFPDKEIILVKNDIQNNLTINSSEQLSKASTTVEYKKDTGKILQRYDIVNMAKGEYILFIEGDDAFKENDVLSQIYNKASQDDVDILEYKSYHQSPPRDKILYQPEIFSAMYFSQDDFNKNIQFHICGKLIKREFFLNTFQELRIDPFYFEENIQKFDQSMILLILFRKAQTFEALNIQATKKQCSKCEKDKYTPEINDAIDLLIYMKFLIQYTENHVPEKRMAANEFVNDFLNKRIDFRNKEELNLLNETLDLYLNCDKIGEQDIRRISEAKKNVMQKLKNF